MLVMRHLQILLIFSLFDFAVYISLTPEHVLSPRLFDGIPINIPQESPRLKGIVPQALIWAYGNASI